MENETKPKQKMKHPDRVTLTPESLARLSDWVSETETRLKGNRISRSDLVNFLIQSHSTSLSEKELQQIESQHFDEVRFYAWALGQLREARAQGKEVSMAEIVASTPNAKKKGDGNASSTIEPRKQ